MKYIKSIPKENEQITSEYIHKGWKLLKEPSSLAVTILISMPIAIILMLITLFYFRKLFPECLKFLEADSLSIEFVIDLKVVLFLLGILIYAFIHEMIHALCIPNAIHSEKVFWGLNGCFGFVFSEEKIKKSRFIVVSVMPLIILSFVLPLIFKIFGFYHWYLLVLCIVNAGGACVDIFNIILVAKQVPSKGMVFNNGMRTLFK